MKTAANQFSLKLMLVAVAGCSAYFSLLASLIETRLAERPRPVQQIVAEAKKRKAMTDAERQAHDAQLLKQYEDAVRRRKAAYFRQNVAWAANGVLVSLVVAWPVARPGLKMHHGLVLSEDRNFSEVIRPLTTEVAPCFWLIRHQSGGPFDSSFVSQNESLFGTKRLDIPACRNTDCSCWRPHTFPRLAEHVFLDEYTSFLALRCDEAQMREWVAADARRFTGEFLGPLEQRADLFLFCGDGWWEMYTPHAEWRRKLRHAFPKCHQRSWRKAGEPPTELHS